MLKHRFQKIIGVALGIIKLGTATRRRVLQDLEKGLSCKTLGNVQLAKTPFSEIVGMPRLTEQRNATIRVFFRDLQKGPSPKAMGKRAFC